MVVIHCLFKKMMKIYRVYIDTNIFKFSAVKLPRLIPRVEILNWGDFNHTTNLHDYVEINPNNSINNPKLKHEANLLPSLSKYEKKWFN